MGMMPVKFGVPGVTLDRVNHHDNKCPVFFEQLSSFGFSVMGFDEFPLVWAHFPEKSGKKICHGELYHQELSAGPDNLQTSYS